MDNKFDAVQKITDKFFYSSAQLFYTDALFSSAIAGALNNESQKLVEAYGLLYDSLQRTYTEGDVFPDVIMKQMPSICFIFLVSAFEEYLLELTLISIRQNPHKISNMKIELRDLIEKTKEEIIEHKAKEHLNAIMFKKPSEYLDEVGKILSIDTSGLLIFWKDYIEIKARRDLGVHNGWIKNDIYLRKLSEVNIKPPLHNNLKPALEYLRHVYYTCGNIAATISNDFIKKHYKLEQFWELLDKDLIQPKKDF